VRVQYHRAQYSRRTGKILAFSAILLPPLLGGMALSIDYGILSIAHGQLQIAADAAALAGARQLADNTRVAYSTDISSEISAAQTLATSVAQANSVLGAAPVVNSGGGGGGGPSDIVVGYANPSSTPASVSSGASYTLYNAVQVTLSRSGSHGGVIPTFFGGILGITNPDVSVTSIAICQPYTIAGFKSVNSLSAYLLPIVIDSTTYNSMINTNGRSASSTSDVYSYNSSTGAVSGGSDGVYESAIFPVGTTPGNFNTVKIGISSNSTALLSAQISNGISPAQLSSFSGGEIQLSASTGTITFGGNPGISAGLQSALSGVIGRAVTVPIYTSVSGVGNNTTYSVSAFGGARVMAVNFSGNPKYLIVQPALVTDPDALPGAPQSGWTAGGVIQVYLAQ
jgi:Flp pilus assembly protein TadG